jgi:predicted ATP-binding protein involved in virulence
MRISTLRFKNFKCFESREFSFGSRFNLVIGDNATGKTTLLDGLAVGLGSLFLGMPHPASPRSIQRDEALLAFFRHGDVWTAEQWYPVSITCTGEVAGHQGEWTRAVIKRDGRTMRYKAAWIRQQAEQLTESVRLGEPVVLPVISYYGTGRLWMQLRQREIEMLKPDTRFMGYLDCLNPASDVKRLLAWFKTQEVVALQRGVPNKTLEAARRAILSCVADAQHIGFDVARGELMVRFGDHSFPFRYLSDGYRNIVAMAADIAIRCATLNPQLGENAARDTPGVVLIDEVDLHLHPRWQRHVVDDLLRAFPKIQFFGTSHSPFIIQSLRPIEGVSLLNLDNPQAENFVNKSVEDIAEDVQGVELPQRSKRFRDMMRAAEEYFAILKRASDLSPRERDRLKARLDELSLPYSDDPAYQAFLKVQRAASGIDGNGEGQ